MIPPTITSIGTPGASSLIARATQTEAKMAGKVGPPRKPLLNATASRASFTSAITTSSAGPYLGRVLEHLQDLGLAREEQDRGEHADGAEDGTGDERPLDLPFPEAPEERGGDPEHRARDEREDQPEQPEPDDQDDVDRRIGPRGREVEVVLEPGAAHGEEHEVPDRAADEVGGQVAAFGSPSPGSARSRGRR